MKDVFLDCIRFDSAHIGGLVKWRPVENGRKKPVIRPMSSGMRGSLKLRTKTVPYELSSENIVEVRAGSFRFIFALPLVDIPNHPVDRNKLMETLNEHIDDEVGYWKEKAERHEEMLKLTKKNLLMAKERLEEQGGETDDLEQYHACKNCNRSSKQSRWEKNGWMCPECNQGKPDMESGGDA